MPKIAKIRIVGTKYDNFKKCHDNTIFDLNNQGNPDHTLYTLQNQSGKGVLMQLISQIVLPNTRWGKNDGNKITGMFLNKNNKFSPYTFHVVLEWKLDTVPDKWLITGICVTATKKTSSKDMDKDDEKIGIKYFLYTHEHYGNGPYTVENLPVYLKEDKKAVSYEEFDDFLAINKRDFRRFSEASARSISSDYYRYLEGHGIYRSEWSILKLINKVEGGVGDYFSKAKDNKGIFDEYIIPAISENLNNQFDENKNLLRDIFKSNISITKNLPILINREEDYKNLMIMLDPLIQDADAGIAYEKRKDKVVLEGNDLYCSLISLQNNVIKEITIWNKEKEIADNRKKELSFEKDNLEFAKQNRTKREYELEIIDEKEELSYIKAEIEDLKEKKKRYEINKLIIPMELDEKKKNNEIEKMKNLLDSLDLKDIEKEIEKVDDEIKEKWESTSNSWTGISKQHKAYEGFLNAKKEELERDIKKLKAREEEIKVNLKTIENRKEQFLKEEKKFGAEFGYFRIACPELLLEDIKKENEKESKRSEELRKKIEKLEAELNSLSLKVNKLELIRDNSTTKRNKEEEKYRIQKQVEDELFFKIVDLCKLDSLEEIYSQPWIQNKFFEIVKLKEEKRNKLNELKKELWENNIDLSLNNKEYWIPNNDANIIKGKIEALGVKVIYGTQFLASLTEEEKKEQLRSYPLIPFSLIITGIKDWETIGKNISKDIFIRSVVPIYIRSEMKEVLPLNYRLISHKALTFVENNSEFQHFKEGLSKKEKEIEEAISLIEESVDNIDKVLNEIQNMLNSETSIALQENIKNILLDIENISNELSSTNTKINDSNENLQVNRNKENKILKLLKIFENQIKSLEEFIIFKNEIEEKIKESKIEQERLNAIEQNLREKEDEKNNISKRIYSENERYVEWKIKVSNKLVTIKEVVEEAVFEEGSNDGFQIGIEPSFEALEEDSIFIILEHRKSLNSHREEKSYKIKLHKERIEELQLSIDKVLKSLKKLDEKWEKYKLENLSLETAEIEFDTIVQNLEMKDKLKEKVQTTINKKEGYIDSLNKDIKKWVDKIYEDHNRTPHLWEDLNLDEKTFKLKENIDDNNKYLQDIENILRNLNSRDIEMKGLISEVKPYEELDPTKGKTSEYLLDKIKGNEKNEVMGWIQNFKAIKDNIKNHTAKAYKNFDEFRQRLKVNIKDEILNHKIRELIGENTNIANFINNKDSFESMKEHANREINEINSDKLEAENAKEQWASRAARQAIKISECLKEMVNKMVYINENGHAFKLVRLKEEEILPKDENDIKVLLNEYFIECIEKLEKVGVDFDNLDDKTLEKYMSDKAIFSKALRGRYPTLEVYKMTEKNEFLYARPLNEHYATWGAINAGEGDNPEGSGGQTLSINTFIIMMLMNYRKKTIGNENPWTVLMLDNPFGKASGAHVLDPIFTIANKLNFQIIAFAAPEIIKTEISERFPVFWALKINEEEESGKLGSVTGKVVHGGRVRG